jgi:hypothetical protein
VPEVYENLPDLTFDLGEFQLNIERGDYLTSLYDVTNERTNPKFEDMYEFTFAPSYLPDPEGVQLWLLGAQYFRKYYTIFDIDNRKIGIIESNPEVIPPKPMIGVIISLSLLSFCFICFFVAWCRKSRSKKRIALIIDHNAEIQNSQYHVS